MEKISVFSRDYSELRRKRYFTAIGTKPLDLSTKYPISARPRRRSRSLDFSAKFEDEKADVFE